MDKKANAGRSGNRGVGKKEAGKSKRNLSFYAVGFAGLLLGAGALFFFASAQDPVQQEHYLKALAECVSTAGASAQARGLVNKGEEDKVSAVAILQHHAQYGADIQKHFKGETLAYITPWHRRGYEAAVRFAGKLTFVSPVWLQIKPGSAAAGTLTTITGEQDIDTTWMTAVRAASNATRIVPRYILEQFTSAHLTALFQPQTLPRAAQDVCDHVQRHAFDGLTLELLSQLGGAPPEVSVAFAAALARCLAQVHAPAGGLATLIVVLPPAAPAKLVAALASHVDRFSVMTYDYSAGNPAGGPNAPLPWVERTAKTMAPKNDALRSKLLVGLNFYGMHFAQRGGEAIVGSQYLSLLASQQPTMRWLPKEAEHVATFVEKRDTHQVFFPTLHSLQARLDLATRLETGLSIWEIGQGLDCFFDLL